MTAGLMSPYPPGIKLPELDSRPRCTDLWQPVEPRPRKVSTALKVYAKMVTSADKGAVRDLSLLED